MIEIAKSFFTLFLICLFIFSFSIFCSDEEKTNLVHSLIIFFLIDSLLIIGMFLEKPLNSYKREISITKIEEFKNQYNLASYNDEQIYRLIFNSVKDDIYNDNNIKYFYFNVTYPYQKNYQDIFLNQENINTIISTTKTLVKNRKTTTQSISNELSKFLFNCEYKDEIFTIRIDKMEILKFGKLNNNLACQQDYYLLSKDYYFER